MLRKDIKDHQGAISAIVVLEIARIPSLFTGEICPNENHLHISVTSLVAYVGLFCHLLPARFQSATFSMSIVSLFS